MFKGLKVELSEIKLDKSKFTPKELSLIDIEGLSRHVLTVHFEDINENAILAMRDFIRNQYKIPMKYITCEYYQYVACKREFKENKEAPSLPDYLYIEPLNNNYQSYIMYIPVNQSIPLDTSVIINIDETQMKDLKPNYYFFRSNDIQTSKDIESQILKANPQSIYKRPWLNNVHIGSLDIDSKLTFKGKVALSNVDVCNSLTLFGFNRDDDNKLFRIYTFDCFNVTPKNIFELMLKQPVGDECKEFCKAVLKTL
jgi:hypothetical protein